MRLRRSTKPMFVFLALVFAVGFVVFGVGSGSTGIADALSGNFPFFGSSGSSGPNIGKLEKRVREHPKDAQAYRELVNAYRADNRPEDAITPLTTYTHLRPKDTDALNELAGLYYQRATRLQQEVQAKQTEASFLGIGQLIGPSPQSRLGRNLPADPFLQLIATQTNQQLSQLFSSMQSAFGGATVTYNRLAALRPKDPTVQIQLAQVAEQGGDYKTAVKAYRRFLKLAPDDPSAGSVRQRIGLLRRAIQAQGQRPGG